MLPDVLARFSLPIGRIVHLLNCIRSTSKLPGYLNPGSGYRV